MEQGAVRIDKWLWAVRIFKTRTLSAEACRSGKVSINQMSVKASREVKIGDIIIIHQMPIIKTVKALSLLHNRVSAKLVPLHMEDLTPASEYEKIEIMKQIKKFFGILLIMFLGFFSNNVVAQE